MNISSYFIEAKIQNTDIEGDCYIKQIYCLKRNILKELIYYLLCFFSIGLFYLICHWSTSIRCIFLYSNCTLQDADNFLILNHDDEFTIVESITLNNVKGFSNRNLNYFIDD